MHKILARILPLAFLTVLLTSCDSKVIFKEYQSIGSRGWAHKDTVNFKLEQPDSLKTYNLFIHLRANQSYPYNNIYLITAMHFPHGKVIQDTLEYEMALPSGKLMGVSYGDLTESKLWYKKEVVFPEKGTYEFSIRQATRANGQIKPDDTLPGIIDVGFSVEQVIKTK